jgi:hypothetical protein
MDISGKLTKYITDDTDSVMTSEMILVEMTKLQKISNAIDKNLKELEKKKSVSADILFDFKKLSKDLETILRRADNTIAMHEKIIGFGSNGAVEVHGSNVSISKDGSTISITKKELIDLALKLGLAKKGK